MLFSVDQAFMGRDEKRAPLKTPAEGASIAITSYLTFLSLTLYNGGKCLLYF